MKLNKVKSDDHWSICKVGREIVVYNKELGFKHHTHVKNMSAANALVKVARLGAIPRHWNVKMLVSLFRIADLQHADKVQLLITEKLSKTKQSYNNKHRRCG
jgi:hypothetical protein